MTRFVLVRHGQTAWNREIRFRGRMDLALDEVGEAQARAAARRIAATWQVAAVYASPLRRAQQTAQPIAAACGLTVQPLDALLDVDFGAWQGLTPQEAAQRYPDVYHAWRHAPEKVTFPDGESLTAVYERVWQGVQALTTHHPNETVVLVGHQVVNRALLCAVLDLGLRGFWRITQDTGAINVFEARDGTWVVVCLNDTCHLS